MRARTWSASGSGCRARSTASAASPSRASTCRSPTSAARPRRRAHRACRSSSTTTRTLAALAEHRFGAARGATNAVLLTIGTGIGGGLIIDGELYRGSTGAGAELGHMVIELDGPKCQGACPSHGCAEALASGTALGHYGRDAAERDPDSALGKALAAGEEFNGPLVTEAAQAGDATAVEVVEHVGRHLGAAPRRARQRLRPRRDRDRRRRRRRRRGDAARPGARASSRRGR